MDIESIVSNSLKILRNQFKNKKITSANIIQVLDNMDGIDDDFEITDEIIDTIFILYKKPPDPVDEETQSLRLANKKFNQNVKGIIDLSSKEDETNDDDWEPTYKMDSKVKLEWDIIQDKLDKIKNKFEEMTTLAV
jgi:hypothetical protein